MGQAKHKMMEDEDKKQVAIEVAIRADLLNRCEIHDEVYDASTDNYETAYKIANSLISKGDPLVAVFKGNRTELTDLLKNINSEYLDSCPLCDKYRDEND